jgi:hypothetical protein
MFKVVLSQLHVVVRLRKLQDTQTTKETGYTHGTVTDAMDIIRAGKKGTYSDSLEAYHIHLMNKNNVKANETYIDTCSTTKCSRPYVDCTPDSSTYSPAIILSRPHPTECSQFIHTRAVHKVQSNSRRLHSSILTSHRHEAHAELLLSVWNTNIRAKWCQCRNNIVTY